LTVEKDLIRPNPAYLTFICTRERTFITRETYARDVHLLQKNLLALVLRAKHPITSRYVLKVTKIRYYADQVECERL